MKKILFSVMFAAFSLTSNAKYTVVVSPCEEVLNEVYHRELSYEEVKAAQNRLIKNARNSRTTVATRTSRPVRTRMSRPIHN